MAWSPPLRIAEADSGVRLGLDGFGDVEGATLQEAADALVAYMLGLAIAVRSGGVGPICTECSPDPELLDFVWRLGEHAASGGDPRELLFGSNPLAT